MQENLFMQENQDTPLQPLQSYGTVTLPGSVPDGIFPLCVIGQIEGHQVLPPSSKATRYEHLIPLLLACEQSDQVKGVLLLLNTVGGDVEAGLALSELIASMQKPTVSLVLGGGHSIGVPLAVSANHSFIVPSATMTLHPIRINGLMIGASQTYEYMNKMQERVVSFVCRHASIKKETFLRLLTNVGDMPGDIGTLLTGKEAVDCGLINEVGGLTDALRVLKELMKSRERQLSCDG